MARDRDVASSTHANKDTLRESNSSAIYGWNDGVAGLLKLSEWSQVSRDFSKLRPAFSLHLFRYSNSYSTHS